MKSPQQGGKLCRGDNVSTITGLELCTVWVWPKGPDPKSINKKFKQKLLKHRRRKNIKKHFRVKNVQLTQKIKLKKNNMYLMHFVQPVRTMMPVWSACPTTSEPSVPDHTATVYCSRLECERLCAANSSFIIKSENWDGELPTRQSGQEDKKAEGTTSSSSAETV